MTSTGARLVAWARRHVVLIVATVVTLVFVATMAAVITRLYEEKQLRLAAIAEQARMNAQQTEANRMNARDLCQGLNGSNETLRFLLDGALRGRTPTSPPLSDTQRQLTIDIYRRLPETNCQTGEKTYYDPPFPPAPTG